MRKHETAVCGTACTVVWEVGKCESRRQMPFMISIYLLPDSVLNLVDSKGKTFRFIREIRVQKRLSFFLHLVN